MAEDEATDDSSVTRIYVTGLPPSMTKEQVRSHFAATGKYSVTDAHVIPDRRIAFVGFSTHEQAQSAVQYFNRTFVRMSKISATLAKPVQVKRDGSGQAIPVSERVSKKRKRHDADNGEKPRQYPVKDAPAAVDRRSPTLVEVPEVASEELENNRQTPSSEEDAGEDDRLQGPKSDLDWLRAKTNRTLDLLDESEKRLNGSKGPSLDTGAAEPVHQSFTASGPQQTDADMVRNLDQETAREATLSVPNARLFIRNLPFDTREDDLRTLFARHGRISEVHLVTDTKKSTGKGLGYVQFVEPSDAEAALVALDGRDFQGRLMHILPSSDKKTQTLTDFEVSKLPLKQQRAIKRKQNASNSTFSWNSLYMNPDAVLASVADRLGVSKAELLDPASAGAAVKQAHAETSIINETKDYLKTNGVNIEAFKNQSRDNTTLLLKNFSFGTTSEEISEMLSHYGVVDRLLFPPTGTMAMAQYRDSSEAALALKQLAYKNVRGSLLFLEKAPTGVWDSTKSTTPAESTNPEADDKTAVTTTISLFVRNLNFSTTSMRLAEAFNQLPGFLSARVKTRTDQNRPGEVLSMGFGFVEFRTNGQAEAAITHMNGKRLDGHQVLVQKSHKATDLGEERRKEDVAKKLASAKTKIIIKNLPFEATKKDVRALFSAYGQLRTVRMPKKSDSTGRGFAFAEFLTSKEAESAIEALSNTHLLGRRLVLDFVQGEVVDPEAEIRAMEDKVRRHQETLTHHRMTASVRKKFNVDARDDLDPL